MRRIEKGAERTESSIAGGSEMSTSSLVGLVSEIVVFLSVQKTSDFFVSLEHATLNDFSTVLAVCFELSPIKVGCSNGESCDGRSVLQAGWNGQFLRT